MTKKRGFKHNIIAIVYDFDGTLTERPMQEYTVLPKIGMPAKKFWDKVREETKRTKGEDQTLPKKATFNLPLLVS